VSIANKGSGPRRVDILVVGAGPAGSIAALELARTGFSVLVADRLGPAAAKIGETLPGAAIRLLHRLGLSSVARADDDSGHCPISGALTAWTSEALIASDALADPYGGGVRLDRARFDAALRQASQDGGGAFHPANVSALERTAQGWTAGLDDGRQISARWLVDATGRRGKLARLIGARRRRHRPLVAVYRTGQPTLNEDLDRTIIEARPNGWFYTGRVAGGRWAFGFHTSPGEAALLQRDPARWEAIAREAPRLTDWLGQPVFDPGMVFRDARDGGLASPVGEQWVACGDAALSFDPIAGQGLFNALRSGMAAAQHIVATIAGQSDTGYAAELARATSIYTERRRALYAAQRRWPDTPFWRFQRDEPVQPADFQPIRI
jgi:flavin-dependent dehydrogenase